MFNKNDKLWNRKTKLIDNLAGRPRLEIDLDLVKHLCQIQCTKEEIASCFEMSDTTLDRRIKEYTGLNFEAFKAMHSNKGKASLRRQQYLSAMQGNTQMLKFLGQNYLNQSDKIKAETKNENENKNTNANFNIDLSHMSETELKEYLSQLDNILNDK